MDNCFQPHLAEWRRASYLVINLVRNSTTGSKAKKRCFKHKSRSSTKRKRADATKNKRAHLGDRDCSKVVRCWAAHRASAMPNWHGEWSVRAFGVSLKQFAAALERASEARRRAR